MFLMVRFITISSEEPIRVIMKQNTPRRSRPPAGCSIVSPDSSGSGYPVQISGG